MTRNVSARLLTVSALNVSYGFMHREVLRTCLLDGNRIRAEDSLFFLRFFYRKRFFCRFFERIATIWTLGG